MWLHPEDVSITTAVERVMSRQVVSAARDASVSQICAAMMERGVGCAVIVDTEGRLEGVFTERDLVTRVVGRGLDPLHSQVGQVMTTSPLVVTSETSIAEASEILSERGFRHAPVVSAVGTPIGVISMRDLFRVRLVHAEARLEEELRSLQELRGLLAMDEDSRLATLLSVNERLKELALTDELTGLHNYRHFMRRLGEEVARSTRICAPLSLLFADIDHFKRVNVTFGHTGGDLTLKHVARVLRDAVDGPSVIVRLRKSDVVARYGGEEFAILLMDAPSRGAMVVAERIRSALESSVVELQQGASTRITVSIGAAAMPEHAADGAALVQAADVALYRAKAEGRNCVRCAAACSV